ncbi:MAG: hypothetical protein IT243_06990 [Bacteroidia bacterium]|nr:hypothetical protein [Bacteroidia bacterium]
MALNQNHLFEDIEEIKCAIVEKNCSKQRVNFLKSLLEQNGFKVILKNTTPAVTDENQLEKPVETYTIAVDNVSFNPIKAVFNRELITESGKIVSIEYWNQEKKEPDEEKWYWKQ